MRANKIGSFIEQFNIYTLSGLALFGVAFLIYAWMLRFVPLNVAQSFASAQFVSVILASYVFLSEPISSAQWIGIALIAVGIALIGFEIGFNPR